MAYTRRQIMTQTGGAGLIALCKTLGLLPPGNAWAAPWPAAAFAARTLSEVLQALGVPEMTAHTSLTLNAPDIAENGAVVPIELTSQVPGTESMALLVEKNTAVLVARFFFPAGTLPEVQTRIKMAQTSWVFVVAKAAPGFYMAKKEIQVVRGGNSVRHNSCLGAREPHIR